MLPPVWLLAAVNAALTTMLADLLLPHLTTVVNGNYRKLSAWNTAVSALVSSTALLATLRLLQG